MRRAIFLGALVLCSHACAGSAERADEISLENAMVEDARPTADSKGTKDAEVVDLLSGNLPTPLREAQVLQSEGHTFPIATLRALYEFGVEHTDDARPWLLLARDAVRAEITSFVTPYYRRAIEADPRAALQPNVLDDLLEVVRTSSGLELREATELIAAAYDFAEVEEAIEDAVDRALLANDFQGSGRLDGLRHAMKPQPTRNF